MNFNTQFVLILFLQFSITAVCQDSVVYNKTHTHKKLQKLKTHQANAIAIINLHGKKWNSNKVSIVAFHEGFWITLREKRRGVVSSRYYMAFQFDEHTSFTKIDIPEQNSSYIEIDARFLKDGNQQKKISTYKFLVADNNAAKQLILEFIALQKLQLELIDNEAKL